MECSEAKRKPDEEEKIEQDPGKGLRKWMSVKEMGDLLGIRKTDRYWLVHKNVFETKSMYGKMWVNVASFERWYANQARYRKVTGEEPGLELREWSLSPREAAELLEIPEYRAYELIKEKKWETVTVDYLTRIRRDSFLAWYQRQKHYRTREDRLKDQELEEMTITFPEAAAMIGLTRNQFYPILKNPKYAHFFEIVEIAGRRRITKESFQKFLNGQDQYAPVGNLNRHDSSEGPEKQADREELSDIQKKTSPSVYLTAAEAASLANMSRQAITRHVDRGCFGDARHRNMIRIRRDAFEEWMSKRQQEVVQEWRQLQKETEDSV